MSKRTLRDGPAKRVVPKEIEIRGARAGVPAAHDLHIRPGPQAAVETIDLVRHGVPLIEGITECAGGLHDNRPDQRGDDEPLREGAPRDRREACRSERNQDRQDIEEISRTIGVPSPPDRVGAVEHVLRRGCEGAPAQRRVPAFSNCGGNPGERDQHDRAEDQQAAVGRDQ